MALLIRIREVDGSTTSVVTESARGSGEWLEVTMADGHPRLLRWDRLVDIRASDRDGRVGTVVERSRATNARAYQPWDKATDTCLAGLVDAGASTADIAQRMRRSRGSIRSRITKLGLDQPQEDSSTATRHGDCWEYADCAELVDRVGRGQSVQEIAEALCRTPSAIEARGRLLLDLGGRKVRGGRVLDRLADRLDRPTFDWEALLSEHQRGQGGHFWTPQDDAMLRQGWRYREPLGLLAEGLDLGELAVVARLVRLGIAGSLVEVVDWLGCHRNGQVAQRYRLAKHHADMTVHVLHVEGLPGQASPHFEVAFTEEEAHERLAELTGSLPEESRDGVAWKIASRIPGGGPRGCTLTGAAPDRPTRS